MLRVATAFCTLALANACQKNHAPRETSRDEKGPRLSVPPFQIEIALSEAAAKKLRDAHESIMRGIF